MFIVQGKVLSFKKLKPGVNKGKITWRDLHVCETRADAEAMERMEFYGGFWDLDQLRIVTR